MQEFSKASYKMVEDYFNGILNIVGKKTNYRIMISSLEFEKEMDSLSIYENEQLSKVITKFGNLKEEEKIKYRDYNLNLFRNLGQRDLDFYDDMYTSFVKGKMFQGERSCRVTAGSKKKVSLYAIDFVELIPFCVYFKKGEEFNQFEFRERFGEHYNRLMRLFQMCLSKCISESEYNEMFNIAQKDNILKEFFWDINKMFVSHNTETFYRYIDPFNSGILDEVYFKITKKYALLVNLLKPMLIYILYKFLLLKPIAKNSDRSSMSKNKRDDEDTFIYIRSLDAYRVVMEIDACMEDQIPTELQLSPDFYVPINIRKIKDCEEVKK